MLVALVWGYASSRGVGENGAGFNYRGEFYGMSGAEVRPERLGPILDRHVAIRDTTTDVRAITGISPDTAVAAQVRDIGGTAAADRVAWLLMSPDDRHAADPWSDSHLAAAIYPPD